MEADSDVVLKTLALFPDQCEQAWAESAAINMGDTSAIQNVVVCGMGGSRFTPMTAKFLYKDKVRVPYEVVDDYILPSYVNEHSLVILSSYSGTTEETVQNGVLALDKKAKVAVLSEGGKLAEMAKEKNLPGYIFDSKNNPSGQPRLGVGYMLMGHMGLLKSADLLDVSSEEVQEAVTFIREFGKETTKYQTLAQQFKDMYPVIIVSEHLRGFGNGFANQLNESAKSISDFRIISELNHHLLEGLANPPTYKERALFVFFRSGLYSPRIQKRFDLTEEVVSKQGIKTINIELTGSNKLSQVLEAFVISGYTSAALAKIYGVDPIKIPWVDYFKEKLG
jgi:glucose/mannose-6-phosphate isomerase